MRWLSLGGRRPIRTTAATRENCYGAAERMRGVRLPDVEPTDAEILRTIARLTGMIRSGGDPRLADKNIPAEPAPVPNRDALLAAAAAANQAGNVLNKPDANS